MIEGLNLMRYKRLVYACTWFSCLELYGSKGCWMKNVEGWSRQSCLSLPLVLLPCCLIIISSASYAFLFRFWPPCSLPLSLFLHLDSFCSSFELAISPPFSSKPSKTSLSLSLSLWFPFSPFFFFSFSSFTLKRRPREGEKKPRIRVRLGTCTSCTSCAS